MISNFPTKKIYNLGGLKNFKFIPFLDVAFQPAIEQGKITGALTLVNGGTWLNGYATPETLNFKEECVATSDGNIYSQTISGFVPGDHPELIDLLQALEDLPILVQIADTRGQIRLVGSHGFPMTFAGTYDSGSNRSDAKGFNFRISTNSIFRAPVYKP